MIYRITSHFLEKESFRGKPHQGVDFNFPHSTPLKSVSEGVVQKVVDYGSQNIGKGVFIKHSNGETAIYGHMSEISVKQGETIQKGQLIGLSGNTGHTIGDGHLHFGLKIDGSIVSPEKYTHVIQNMDTLKVKTSPFDISNLFGSGDSSFIDHILDVKINLIHLIDYSFFSQLIQQLSNLFLI